MKLYKLEKNIQVYEIRCILYNKPYTEYYLQFLSSDLDIRLSFNKSENKFIIEDNGIGLSETEAMNNLGTIAKSGSQEFMRAVQDEHSASAQERFDVNGVF